MERLFEQQFYREHIEAARDWLEANAVALSVANLAQVLVIGLAYLAAAAAAPRARRAPTGPDDPAAILFSGGTTGSPKGIVLSNRNIVAEGMQVSAWGGVGAGDRILAILPIFHGFGLGVCINAMLMAGGTAVLVPVFSAETAAKLIARKRPLDLLDAYARIASDPAVRAPYLLFAGDGELRPVLEAAIARQKLDGARVLGFQSQAQLAALYDLADLLVLPSERESWGLVVNEAMNAGRAIVASDRIGSAVDLVKPGQNGAIFRCDDVEDFARALRDVIGDADRLAAMGRASRAIIDRWDFDADVAGLRPALAALLPTRAATAPA